MEADKKENQDIFAAALDLTDPWYVEKTEFCPGGPLGRELHIYVNFRKGAKFPCPIDGCLEDLCDVHDTVKRDWRHLNFFQFPCYLHARVPRVKCSDHKTRLVNVPWGRPGSGFTLLFEELVLSLVESGMSVNKASDALREHDTRLWRIIRHYVEEARAFADYSETTEIGIDETSKKGHKYITVFASFQTSKALFVVDGKDKSSVTAFTQDFKEHHGNPMDIKIATTDMSLGFLNAIKEQMPNATSVVDKFHVAKHMNEAVDTVRKEEARENAEKKELLHKSKYLWLKNPGNLSTNQTKRLASLKGKNLKTGRAHAMKLTLQDIYAQCLTKEEAEPALKKFIGWLVRSRLEPMKKFAKTLKNHMTEILNYWPSFRTNALLEGLNSIIQAAKARARGFRNVEYFKTIIYLICGQINVREVLAFYKNI